MNDAELRAHIYDSFITTGRAPRLGDEHRDALQRLADAHMIVIDDEKNIVYAPPWSASPTPFIVTHSVPVEDRRPRLSEVDKDRRGACPPRGI